MDAANEVYFGWGLGYSGGGSCHAMPFALNTATTSGNDPFVWCQTTEADTSNVGQNTWWYNVVSYSWMTSYNGYHTKQHLHFK